MKELDQLQRRLEIAWFVLCGVLFAVAAGCYAGVLLSAWAGNGPATTACVAFAVLSSGSTAAVFKTARGAQKRRRDRKQPPETAAAVPSPLAPY
ncbi:hypothetical protein ACIRJO_19920 [Streptomyces sp. NPDC102394]|uniref:hypothetical protein n=1 Tax=Streptomyces sp. NPDC102394 TaxID=3366167 RepID=UPI00382DE63A